MTAAFGFFGKIPSRGDFVRNGLPPGFTVPLDEWFQRGMAESRGMLGAGWVDAWMEAPVWRFAFGAAVCGGMAAAGLWMPSTDKAGRLFPLVLAVVAAEWTDLARCGAFLGAAEEVGRWAIEGDPGPEALGTELAAVARLGGEALAQPGMDQGVWWTEGSPLVAAARRDSRGLPDPAAFTSMLRDRTD